MKMIIGFIISAAFLGYGLFNADLMMSQLSIVGSVSCSLSTIAHLKN